MLWFDLEVRSWPGLGLEGSKNFSPDDALDPVADPLGQSCGPPAYTYSQFEFVGELISGLGDVVPFIGMTPPSCRNSPSLGRIS